MAVKSSTSYQQQLQILEAHGCTVADKADCIKRLSEIGYYRLSAYFAPFRNPDKSFRTGTNFEAILRVYEFDGYSDAAEPPVRKTGATNPD